MLRPQKEGHNLYSTSAQKFPPMLQQGEFYELPVIGISDEPEATFFIVQSEGQEYKVKMYNFQRNDLEQR